MRFSDTLARFEPALTAGLTAVVTLLLLGAAWLIPLDTRNASGAPRRMTTIEVWREVLDNLPPDAPFVRSREVLIVLIPLALVMTAYVIVAIARLPR